MGWEWGDSLVGPASLVSELQVNGRPPPPQYMTRKEYPKVTYLYMSRHMGHHTHVNMHRNMYLERHTQKRKKVAMKWAGWNVMSWKM